MSKRRTVETLFAFLLVLGPAGGLSFGCKKDEPAPLPTTLPSDEDEKPKKKKKSTDDEEPAVVNNGGDDPGAGTASVKPLVTGTGGKTDPNAAKKAALQACCTALHNAASAAGIANTAASNAIPGLNLPAPPAKEEAEKQAKACDQAVIEFTGDLNTSLKKVKGASPVALPSACNITG